MKRGELVSIVLLVVVLLCVVALKWEDWVKGPPTTPSTQASDYSTCVANVLVGSREGDSQRSIEVTGLIHDFVSIGPKEKRAQAWKQLQQHVTSDIQFRMIDGCAKAAGVASTITFVIVELAPRRKGVSVVQLGAAAAGCSTGDAGSCPIPVFEPEKPVRMRAQSQQYDSDTRLLEAAELESGFAHIAIRVRAESLLTIVADEAGHPYLGWVVVTPSFDGAGGELTSEECFREFSWDPVECLGARADKDGRVAFRHTAPIRKLRVELRDYRPAVRVWEGTPDRDRIEVYWPTRGVVAPTLTSAASRPLACGSRPNIESLLARAPWETTGEFDVSLNIDERGRVSAVAGVPAEIATDLQNKTIPVVSACKPTVWTLSYRAKS